MGITVGTASSYLKGTADTKREDPLLQNYFVDKHKRTGNIEVIKCCHLRMPFFIHFCWKHQMTRDDSGPEVSIYTWIRLQRVTLWHLGARSNRRFVASHLQSQYTRWKYRRQSAAQSNTCAMDLPQPWWILPALVLSAAADPGILVSGTQTQKLEINHLIQNSLLGALILLLTKNSISLKKKLSSGPRTANQQQRAGNLILTPKGLS